MLDQAPSLGKGRVLVALALGLLLSRPPWGAEARDAASEGQVELDEKELRSLRRQFKGKCSRCHGVKGDGAGTHGEGLQTRPADFTDALFMAARTDEQLFHQIDRGGEELSAMPAFGRDSNQGWGEKKIRRMVAYLRTLPVDEPRAEAQGEAPEESQAGAEAVPTAAAGPSAAVESSTVGETGADDEGPKPIVPERVKPGIAYYADESAISGGVRGLLQERNYEEVYQNYTYFEAWYDEAGRVVVFREYRRGDVILTESYSYDSAGRLSEKTLAKPGEEPVVRSF